METLETKNPASPELDQLKAQYEALHHLIVTVLILMVIVSGTLSVYLLRQWRMTSKDLTAFRPAAMRFINEYNTDQKPRMDAVVESLKEYGRTDVNFAPILAKYGLGPGSAAPATASPTSAPAKKK